MQRFALSALSKHCAIAFVALAFASVAADAHRYEWYDGQWAYEKTTVKADPAITFGRLENGLRWAVLPNKNPIDRISLRLNVQAGSLMEADHELGIAHYLEHMAFNGSTHFPPGALIPFFQKHGMNFGGDTNAHTSHGETVFKLNLASKTTDSIREGLFVLRDMTDGLGLYPHEVDEERGIILAEKRVRENESYLAGREWADFIHAGTKLTHTPIGLTETIERIDAPMIRAFYEKWYVPGRMSVVFSGDIKPQEAETLMKEVFGSLKAKPLPTCPEIGTPDTAGVKALVQKRPISFTKVGITVMSPALPVCDSEERQRAYFIEQIEQIALSRRLSERRDRDPGIWDQAIFRDSRSKATGPTVMLAAATDGAHWKETLKGLQEELQRAKIYGLTPAEFETVADQVERSLRRAVKQREAWTNEDYADNFIALENAGLVSTSPEQDLERFLTIRQTLTLDEVNRHIARAFAPDNRRLQLSGNVDTDRKTVENYWKTIADLRPSAPAVTAAAVFPYLDAPSMIEKGPAFETKTETFNDMTLTRVSARLPNGIELLFVPLPYDKGTVRADFVFGDGVMGVTDQDSRTLRMALRVLQENGIGRLTESDMNRLFAGRGFAVSEGSSLFSNVIRGAAERDDLPLLLEGIRTQYLDPTLTERNRSLVLTSIRQTAFSRRHEVANTVKTLRSAFFTGSEIRKEDLEVADVKEMTLADMRRTLSAVRERGNRLLLVTGDFDLEKAKEAAVRTFGALPVVQSPAQRLGAEPVFPAGRHETRVIKGDTLGKSVLLKAWHCNLEDVSDQKTVAARSLASAVIRERLRLVLREELGVAYSPSAYYREMTEFKGFGYLLMQVDTEIGNEKAVLSAIDRLAADLIDKGTDRAELERLKKPILTSWASQRKTNSHWQSLILTSQTLPHPYLAWFEDSRATIESLTAEDVNRELKRILTSETASLFVRSERKDR